QDTIRFPSRVIAKREIGGRFNSSGSFVSEPVFKSHIRTVRSLHTEMTLLPSGWNSSVDTNLFWPSPDAHRISNERLAATINVKVEPSKRAMICLRYLRVRLKLRLLADEFDRVTQ